MDKRTHPTAESNVCRVGLLRRLQMRALVFNVSWLLVCFCQIPMINLEFYGFCTFSCIWSLVLSGSNDQMFNIEVVGKLNWSDFNLQLLLFWKYRYIKNEHKTCKRLIKSSVGMEFFCLASGDTTRRDGAATDVAGSNLYSTKKFTIFNMPPALKELTFNV